MTDTSRTTGAHDGATTIAWSEVAAASFAREAAWTPEGRTIHSARLSAFAISRTPITNAQFAAFRAAGGYEQERWWTVLGWRHRRALDWREPNEHDETWPEPDAPVTGVSWWEAMAFARWAGGTLPTDAQWEHAATLAAGWRDAVVDLQPSPRAAHPAGAALRRTCLDLVGATSEWCLDNAGIPRWSASQLDPVWETSETDPHVTRGACGLHDLFTLRCTGRDQHLPDRRDAPIGFRVVRQDGPVRTSLL